MGDCREGRDPQEGGTAMLQEIQRSSLVLTVLISAVLVAGVIFLLPSLMQTYYWRIAGAIAGAGLLVTLYNRLMAARARRRTEHEPLILEKCCTDTCMDTADDAPVRLDASVTILPRKTSVEENLPESLEALLDIAYESAETEPLRAVAAYRRALSSYPNDSYMPFLIIELSTLYKRLGNYAAALDLLDEALTLPIIAKNVVMVQEFERSRKILRAVSDMLTARGTPALPFGDVPEDVLAAADRQADGQ